ncbi:MAG: type II toxin-antitoxin system RelE/ParE family toxin, partial [Cytophagales bacterium]
VKFAKIQIIKVKMRTKILKQNPQAGKMVIELDKANIRELVEGNYRIVYKILDEHSIDILTIHHGARDISGRGIVF